MLYFDTSYLVRLYTRDAGWEKVRALAQTDRLACSLLGKAETAGALHRKFREGAIDQPELKLLWREFEKDCFAGAYRWLPFSETTVTRLSSIYANLPPGIALRAADGIHLASASEAGFTKIYSNDARLLSAATDFGLTGANIMA